MTKIKLNTILVLTAAIVATASLATTGCKKSETTAEGQKYTCEMHPEVVQDKPGDCPKCHMKLTAKR